MSTRALTVIPVPADPQSSPFAARKAIRRIMYGAKMARVRKWQNWTPLELEAFVDELELLVTGGVK